MGKKKKKERERERERFPAPLQEMGVETPSRKF
jgi:hypothetical protein